MTDIYGQRCLELSDSVDRPGLLQKMCLALFPCLTPSLKTWKEKTIPGKRILYRLVLQAHHTNAKGYGLLPTVTASDATMGAIIGKNDQFKLTGNGTLRRYTRNGHNSSLSLGRLLMLKNGLLPTPTVSTAQKEQRICNPVPSDPNGRILPQRLASIHPSLIGKKTNPQFLEWMMGYPKDWTAIGP